MPLPAEFLQSIVTCKGLDVTAFEAVHQSGGQLTSVRLNPSKPLQNPAAHFNMSLLPASQVPWSSYGLYLEQRPSFTSDPLFHAGTYYVQEASSMFVEEVIRQCIDRSAAIKVLDLCAAPGGKSTLIQTLLNAQSLLVSNEVIKTRVTVLMENMTKWGAANVIVTNNDARDFQRLPGYFDVMVVDAPCSGSGLFRKDADAQQEWSVQNVQLCSGRQQRILADALPALKAGGLLIYSTCSYSKEEDENIADWLIENGNCETRRLSLEKAPGVVETASGIHGAWGYRFYPDKVKGEGFYLAAFIKKENSNGQVHAQIIKKGKTEKASKEEVTVMAPWLSQTKDKLFVKLQNEVIAVPLCLENELYLLQQSLYIKKAGVKIGTVIRNELVPHHELALSTMIHPDVAGVELDKGTALCFLRKQDIHIISNLKGWAVVKYLGLTLGWIKILPGRINNYYPKEWRIVNR